MATLQIRPGLSTPAPRFYVSRAAAFKPPVHLRLPACQQASLGMVAGGGREGRKMGRWWRVVRRGAPSTSSYVFAFALPFSLLIFTIFTSIRIADKLDQDYLEELELNEAIMEAEGIEYAEDEDENIDGQVSPEKEEEEEEEVELPQPALSGSRIRNRPKRQV
ncbi:hypothetical protein LINGRAHAP2_LOCUS30138 [Linum grandiflorum]